MTWETVRRAASSSVGSREPAITLRRAAIAFNAAFVRLAEIEKCSRVTLHVNKPERKLGFKFHNDQTDMDSLAVSQDGGGRGLGRITQASALLRQHWLASLIRNRPTTRFSPYKEQGMWVIQLGPSFESEAESPLDVPVEATGVYRYLLGEECVYIGRGLIRQRLQVADRQHWSFDRVQYSVMNDREAEHFWEQVLLDEHEASFGRLPRENRVRGYAPSSPAEDT